MDFFLDTKDFSFVADLTRKCENSICDDVEVPDAINGRFVNELKSGPCVFRNVSFSPNSIIKEITDSNFADSTSLVSIKLPSSIITIRNRAFFNCINLNKVVFMENTRLGFIGKESFYNCGIKNLIIPRTVKYIGSKSFYSCKKLELLVFQEKSSLDRIGDQAFSQCDEIKSVVLPRSLTKIGAKIFSNCLKLESILLHRDMIIEQLKDHAFDDFTISYGKNHKNRSTLELKRQHLPKLELDFSIFKEKIKDAVVETYPVEIEDVNYSEQGDSDNTIEIDPTLDNYYGRVMDLNRNEYSSSSINQTEIPRFNLDSSSNQCCYKKPVFLNDKEGQAIKYEKTARKLSFIDELIDGLIVLSETLLDNKHKSDEENNIENYQFDSEFEADSDNINYIETEKYEKLYNNVFDQELCSVLQQECEKIFKLIENAKLVEHIKKPAKLPQDSNFKSIKIRTDGEKSISVRIIHFETFDDQVITTLKNECMLSHPTIAPIYGFSIKSGTKIKIYREMYKRLHPFLKNQANNKSNEKKLVMIRQICSFEEFLSNQGRHLSISSLDDLEKNTCLDEDDNIYFIEVNNIIAAESNPNYLYLLFKELFPGGISIQFSPIFREFFKAVEWNQGILTKFLNFIKKVGNLNNQSAKEIKCMLKPFYESFVIGGKHCDVSIYERRDYHYVKKSYHEDQSSLTNSITYEMFPFIVGCWNEEGKTNYLLEYVRYIKLSEVIHDESIHEFWNIQTKLKLIYQINKFFCRTKDKYQYGRLSPSNIFMDIYDDYQFCLLDFIPLTKDNFVNYSNQFCAPELEKTIDFPGINLEKSDVFTFGRVIFEILYHIKYESFDHKIEKQIDKLLKISQKCLSINPQYRPSFDEINQELVDSQISCE